MQTFLPFPSFAGSAEVLDDRRLGKQRVETLQILRALHFEGYGWRHHPAVTMWRGYTDALVTYGVTMVDGWVERGHRDTTRAQIAEFVHPEDPRDEPALAAAGRLPPWMGWEPLHRSHRAALLRKDPAHYAPLLPDTPVELDYVWPEPPAPEPEPGPRTAWVVRGTVADGLVAVPAAPGEEPAAWAPVARRERKRDRQVRRLTDGIAPGDRVVVPGDDATLRIGIVAGPYRYDEDRGAHVRPVQWLGELPRRALDFPAALQDPQAVFALHGEPVVAALAPSR
ncbi:MSMEG_6728 family protein [Egicoccus sp. AB-alg6-2]|uniref:MSMEG_6728 family protein n=1 Tax=Egicoccus sp. AB-alg6-2 TaxID=3242692 RepID=UPI00359D76C8